jgi:hypothetical protein
MHLEIPHPLESGFGMTGVFGEDGGRSGDSPVDPSGFFQNFIRRIAARDRKKIDEFQLIYWNTDNMNPVLMNIVPLTLYNISIKV